MENTENKIIPLIYTASGCVRKNKEGRIMSTKTYVKKFAKVLELQTKIGKREVYLFENPRDLPVDVKDMIFDDFYPVALSAFNQNKSVNFEKDVYHHLFEVDGLALFFHDDVQYGNNSSVEKGIAFRTYSMLDKDTMYVEGTAVDPNYHGLGFYQAVTKATVGNAKYVTSRTQNPVVITALNRIFGNVAPITRLPDEKDKEIATMLADKLKMSLERENMIGRGTYGKMLTGMLPKINNGIRNEMYSQIDPAQGDCVIAVCKV